MGHKNDKTNKNTKITYRSLYVFERNPFLLPFLEAYLLFNLYTSPVRYTVWLLFTSLIFFDP